MKTQKLNIDERASCSLFFLSFRNLSLSLGNKSIFNNISLDFKFNKLVLIKGRVGSGKSSFLKMLGSLIAPSSGDYFLSKNHGDSLSSIYIHSQPEFNFITGYVRDELLFAGVPIDDFTELAGRSIYDMSGGELKKLSIMMAVARNDQSILLVDEPLDMLDDIEAGNIASLIIKESETRPFIIATHDSHFDNDADIIITIEDDL